MMRVLAPYLVLITSYFSGMIDQFKALNFTTTYSGSHPNQILTGSGRQIDGKSLNVLHPVDDQFPMTNDISFFINGDNISAKLPLGTYTNTLQVVL